ncbi:MAG: hypothetical protein V4690_01110 [Patescibacteria group bacterium]
MTISARRTAAPLTSIILKKERGSPAFLGGSRYSIIVTVAARIE